MFRLPIRPRKRFRKHLRRRRLAAAALAAFSALLWALPVFSETQTQCIGTKVCLDLSWNQDEIQIDARNRTTFPVALQLDFARLSNLLAVPRLRDGRARTVLAPRGARNVVILVRQDARRGAELPFTWSFVYGDPQARHDDSISYRFPFGGREDRLLSQGANGEFTHKGASAYAYDFAMPIGTPIVAARGGRVVEISDGYTDSGVSPQFLDKANAVTILHSDGTFATYAHLDPGSGVREGMDVRIGDVLGFSGNTGFSTGPHLHFSVWKASTQNAEGAQSIPIRFRDPSNGRAIEIAEGRSYAPTCHEGGLACRPGELGSALAAPAPGAGAGGDYSRNPDGSCRCSNGAVITTRLPCRAVCP